MLFLTGALPALPGLQCPGTPQMSLVLWKAEELGFSMSKQHLPPKNTYPEICSSAHSAKKAPGASKFQSNGSDLRNAGDGCCREGEAGLGRNGRDMLLAESPGVKKNIQVSLFHVSFSVEWLWLLM